MKLNRYDPSRLDPNRNVSDVGLFILCVAAFVAAVAAIGGVIAENIP